MATRASRKWLPVFGETAVSSDWFPSARREGMYG
jgi:hypothetical protein